MAVSKTFPPEEIAEAHAAGVRVFGEKRDWSQATVSAITVPTSSGAYRLN